MGTVGKSGGQASKGLGAPRGETRVVARRTRRGRTRRTRRRTQTRELLRGASSHERVAGAAGGARPAPAREGRAETRTDRTRAQLCVAGGAVLAARRHGRRGERRVPRDDERVPRADGGPTRGFSAEAVLGAGAAGGQDWGGASRERGGGGGERRGGDAVHARDHQDSLRDAKDRGRPTGVARSQERVRQGAATQEGRVRRPRAQHVRAENVQGFRRHRSRAKKRGGEVSYRAFRDELAGCRAVAEPFERRAPSRARARPIVRRRDLGGRRRGRRLLSRAARA